MENPCKSVARGLKWLNAECRMLSANSEIHYFDINCLSHHVRLFGRSLRNEWLLLLGWRIQSRRRVRRSVVDDEFSSLANVNRIPPRDWFNGSHITQPAITKHRGVSRDSTRSCALRHASRRGSARRTKICQNRKASSARSRAGRSNSSARARANK